MSKLEKNIGYSFKDRNLLITALTHSSFANEHRCESYERLEFLGDSILGFVTAEFLYSYEPKLPEGRMTRKRSEIVCEKNLQNTALRLDIGSFMRLGHGEIHTGGRTRPSILADMVESIIAAIYLDSGFENAKNFIYREILDYIDDITEDGCIVCDYKTQLQELLQKNGSVEIKYIQISETGPDHDKVFEFSVESDGIALGSGKGRTKKEAEQMAARSALEEMK